MDDLPAIVRLPLRLLLALMKFVGKLVIGVLIFVLGFFGIGILAAYPQLPAHEQRYVLWGGGILAALFVLGSMAWVWILLQNVGTTYRARKNSMGYPPLDSNPRGADQPVNVLIRTLIDRVR